MFGGCLGFLNDFFPSTVSKWAPITSFKEGGLTPTEKAHNFHLPVFFLAVDRGSPQWAYLVTTSSPF